MAPLFDRNLSLFCGEPDSPLALDKPLIARHRYSSTLATNLETQLNYSMEEPQRVQIAHPADFEFGAPAEFLRCPCGERDAFTEARLSALSRYIRHIACT